MIDKIRIYNLQTKNIFTIFTICHLIYLSATKEKSEVTPNFNDYKVETIFKGKHAPLNIKSHPTAREFRTKIREAIKNSSLSNATICFYKQTSTTESRDQFRKRSNGPNFAGHYTIATWGAGTEVCCCAIVDAKTGNVIANGPISNLGYEYRLDSKLLIVNPPQDVKLVYGIESPTYIKTYYFKWENNKFILLKEIKYN